MGIHKIRDTVRHLYENLVELRIGILTVEMSSCINHSAIAYALAIGEQLRSFLEFVSCSRKSHMMVLAKRSSSTKRVINE